MVMTTSHLRSLLKIQKLVEVLIFIYTEIRFVSRTAKFGMCMLILASSSVQFIHTIVQMPNIALIETKRMKV